MNAAQLSGSTLAFVGDAVYGLMVRERLAETERPLSMLHKYSVEFVNANAQAEAFELIKDMLTEEEAGIFKRGRNSKVSNIPKNSGVSEYHAATGLEALFGYLYLAGERERLCRIFDIIWQSKSKDVEKSNAD